MAKKNFQKAPKPETKLSPEAIAAYENNGIGKDTQNHKPTNDASESSVKRLSVDIAQELHTKFKTCCSAHNLSMKNEIIDFIERRVKELS